MTNSLRLTILGFATVWCCAGVGLTSMGREVGVSYPAAAFTGGLDPSISHVLTTGFWEKGQERGYFRLVVFRYIGDTSVSLAYLQRLRVFDDGELREVETAPIEEVNGSQNSIITSVRGIGEGSEASIEVTMVSRYDNSRSALLEVQLMKGGGHRIKIRQRKG